MSKTVNPIGFRLGINRYWNSQYYLFDYASVLKKQLLIQNVIYAKLKTLNIKIIDYKILKKENQILVNVNVFITPYDINSYISKMVYQRYVDFLKKNKVKDQKINVRQKAQEFVYSYISMVQKYYFLVLILVNIELERILSKMLGLPVKIQLKNNYYYNLTGKSSKLINKMSRKMFYYSKRNKSFRAILDLVNVATTLSSSYLIAQLIASEMEKTRRHTGLLKMLHTVLNNFLSSTASKLLGVKFKISGKLNGRLRATSTVFEAGLKVPSQRLSARVEYSFLEAFTYTGVFGIKVWTYLGTEKK